MMPQLDISQFDAVLLELLLVLFFAFLLADSDDDLRNVIGDNSCWLTIVILRAALWFAAERTARRITAIQFTVKSSQVFTV